MNLKHYNSRIHENSDGRIKHILFFFDKIFDNLEIEKTEPNHIQFNWYDSKTGKKLFERNHWGRFWVYDCKTYRSLQRNITGILNFNNNEFHHLLLEYLNNRYKENFEGKNLKDVASETCPEVYESDEELVESRDQTLKVRRLIEMTEFEDEDSEKKKEMAKKLIKKYLTLKIRYTDKLGEDYLDFKKNGQTQLQYSIKNISTFNGKIDKPFLLIGYQFLMQLARMFSFKNILSEDEIIQTIIDWFNEKYNKNVTPNGWGWVND